MIKQDIQIINQLGLHARAAAKLVSMATRFESSIEIEKENRRVDAKSIMSVMMLAAGKGTNIEFEIDGPDEQAAMDAIVALIKDKFGEEE